MQLQWRPVGLCVFSVNLTLITLMMENETYSNNKETAPKHSSHPLSDFRFCPHCGAETFEEHDPWSKRCATCGFTFYPNASAATAAFIINEQGELLCIRRDREPARGTLDLPGGFVDPGESITDGFLRELKEEVGVEVTAYHFLFSLPNAYPFSGHIVSTADAFFLCRISNPNEVCAHDDASAVAWVRPENLDPAAFGLHSVSLAVERFLGLWKKGEFVL